MQLRYFGTDGIRGTFGEAPMDLPLLRRLGFALARFCETRENGRKCRVVAGRDSRASGPAILGALAEGLTAAGHQVLDAGIVPTPAVATAVLDWNVDLGLMITASHNPPGDNGVKIFDSGGLKLEPAAEAEIEVLLDRAHAPAEAAPAAALTSVDALEPYCVHRAAALPAQALAGWVVAVDCGHGATGRSTPAVLRRLGATVHARGVEPDGARINVESGSEHPARLAALVRACGARLGVAHDGDGDRLVVCDETGVVADGDEVLGVLARHALRQGALRGGIVVATVQSNLGLDQAVAAAGGRVARVAVGDRQVLHKLLELDASLGGENSGHYIFPDIARCGDGLLAALQLMKVMRDTGRALSDLRRDVPLLPQLTANLRVRAKTPFDALPGFAGTLRAAEETLAGRGRVLARYSGTERKLRLLVEGPARGELEKILASLAAEAAKELGAE